MIHREIISRVGGHVKITKINDGLRSYPELDIAIARHLAPGFT